MSWIFLALFVSMKPVMRRPEIPEQMEHESFTNDAFAKGRLASLLVTTILLFNVFSS